MELKVTEHDLIGFEKDLWKDTRKLEIETHNGHRYIRRYSDNQTSIRDEYEFISNLIKGVSFNVPRIYDHSDMSISFDYIAGTRAFNLLMDLRALYRQERNSRYIELGTKLVDLLAKNLTEFQSFFAGSSSEIKIDTSYPVTTKLTRLFSVLTSILSIETDLTDLQPITEIYRKQSSLPFRDATTKNVILDLPNLFQKRFSSYEERLQTIDKLVLSGELNEKLVPSTIYHIDFSGCCYLCPTYDDWVALREHEATSWLDLQEIHDIDHLSPGELCAKFVRYSRFGGRKLAYRLLNIQGYRIRFALDSERFYFSVLKRICKRLRAIGVISTDKLEQLMMFLEHSCEIVPKTDYFLIWKHSQNKFNYYRDVFPG